MGKRKVIAVLDSETCPIVPMGGEEVDPRKMRVYDVGFIIKDKRTPHVYAERSYLVTDWYYSARHYMESAYYAAKLPQYRAGCATGGEWVPMPLCDVWAAFTELCKEFGVSEVWAFNCRFDATVLNESIKDASGGFRKYFAPYGVKWRDIWPLAQLITGTAKYNEWAYQHGYFSPAGIAKTNVEIITRYLTGEHGFSERHTALDDARHEAAIMDYLRFSHYKTPDRWGRGYDAAMRYAKRVGHYVSPRDRAKSSK